MSGSQAKKNLEFQKLILFAGIVLFLTKVLAWYFTRSVAILTDALESTINVASGFIGWYSLYIAAQPKDTNHPYGHGKAEFISAAVEGTLIGIAGSVILYEAVIHLKHASTVARLDQGMILIAATAVVNYLLGYFAIRQGKKNNSLALAASGKHLQSDTWSTLGIILGLLLMLLTGWVWLDAVVAIIFGSLLIYNGYKILRTSLAGIMDEADRELLEEVVAYLQKERRPNWIDLHNLRIIKYGSTLHLDCHLTVPWYLNIREAHDEVDMLSELIRNKFGESLELFVHTDPCLEFSCRICTKTDCAVRQHAFERQVVWTVENISYNAKHSVDI